MADSTDPQKSGSAAAPKKAAASKKAAAPKKAAAESAAPKAARAAKPAAAPVAPEVAPRAEPSQDDIRRRAYELWLAHGGSAAENWLEAERQLRG